MPKGDWPWLRVRSAPDLGEKGERVDRPGGQRDREERLVPALGKASP